MGASPTTVNNCTPTTYDPTWRWCLSCQRCYTRHSDNEPNILSRCFYPDCNGAAMVCEYRWERIRRYDSSFPRTPRFGVRYRIYL